MKVQFKAERDDIEGKEVDIVLDVEGLENRNFVNLVIEGRPYIVSIHDLLDAVNLFYGARIHDYSL